MTIVFLQTHVLTVSLFLLLFLVKAVMLFLNKHKTLDKTKRYTKVLDVVFGALIVMTGSYLLVAYKGVPGWLIFKVLLVLLAVPTGIAGLSRHNKPLTLAALLLFSYAYVVSETKSLIWQKEEVNPALTQEMESPETDVAETGDSTLSHSEAVQDEIVEAMGDSQLQNAKAIYMEACASCHGPDGTLGLGGAPDLKQSNLSQNERINVIQNGRGLMPSFNTQLTEQETEALAAYTMTLKK